MDGPEIEVPRGARWSLCIVEYELAGGTWEAHAEGESAIGASPEDAHAELRRLVMERRKRSRQ